MVSARGNNDKEGSKKCLLQSTVSYLKLHLNPFNFNNRLNDSVNYTIPSKVGHFAMDK